MPQPRATKIEPQQCRKQRERYDVHGPLLAGVGQETRNDLHNFKPGDLACFDQTSVRQRNVMIEMIPVCRTRVTDVRLQNQQASAGAQGTPAFLQHQEQGPLVRQMLEEIAGEDHIHTVADHIGKTGGCHLVHLDSRFPQAQDMITQVDRDPARRCDITDEQSVTRPEIQNRIADLNETLKEPPAKHFPS